MNKLSKFLFGIFLFFALFSWWLFSVFATDVYWGIRSMGWAAVPAHVTAVSNGDAPGRARLAVRYGYSVNGTSWNSEIVAYGGDEDGAQLLLSTLVPGGSVNAFVDPAAPQRAVLIRGVIAAGFFLPCFRYCLPSSP